MRRLRRSPRRALVVIGVLAALLGVPGALSATAGPAAGRPESQGSRSVVTTALERPAHPATAAIDSLVRPPASATPAPRTMYDEYGMAGQFWAATNLQCSDMTSLIGNN